MLTRLAAREGNLSAAIVFATKVRVLIQLGLKIDSRIALQFVHETHAVTFRTLKPQKN
jgi:hypothetical protein